MASSPSTVEAPSSTQYLLGALLTLLSAVAFSSKAILVKLAYRFPEVDPVTLLALRMLFSLPLFLLSAVWTGRRHRNARLTRRDWATLVFLGLMGYYLASLFDFLGLQHVSASMERLILFVYPTIVVLINAGMGRQRIQPVQILALLLTYFGIGLAFAGESLGDTPGNLWLGGALVFASAVTYAIYLVGSGHLIPRLGSTRYTSYAMSIACLGVLTHYAVTNAGLPTELPGDVYGFAVLMALIATVLPAFLLAEGIRIVGSGNASIIGSIGPVSTIVLAYVFLGERLVFLQWIGTALVMAGVLTITLRGKKPGLARRDA
ncbi:Threonine/homoserine efflux transporter RhtA [Catalinimonas alkaloidigena]|uniref:Threonine/homoserine efflux transporter RhtA n=1 Tax=Catalinimonas alkaloidigena TaxID=1075417 RepID=A0A1G9AJ11_9BACT|nr:DMT family transporter [Catalinimonas alkaloidigena]SDK27271.1 Threonine/homoserine efflux transporter RhtA [Catalinimonas alkaloidigena]